MTLSRRTCAAVSAAAISGTLVAGMAGSALAYDDLDCSDFSYQEDAQAVLASGPADPHRLDDSADGVACESLPNRQSESPVSDPQATVPETTPQIAPPRR
jgi:Excalibur calcium-binding domain